MEHANQVSDEVSYSGQVTPEQLPQAALEGFKITLILKKLRGGFLLLIGYLLSPLCWWNDLVFNLPVAYGFGYLWSLLSPDLLVPCSIVGYWLSNIAGILLMQVGAVDVLQGQAKRNLKKELLTGLITSTAYTVAILALMQFNILQTPIPAEINFFPSK